MMKIIFVIPIFNRISNLMSMFSNEKLINSFHFLFVDDYSTDGSFSFIENAGFENVKVIKSSSQDSFWRGCIDDGCQYIKSSGNYAEFDFFGFMNDDILFDESCDFVGLEKLSKDSIWFAPAFWKSKGVFTGGIDADKKKCTVSKSIGFLLTQKDILAVGGFFTIFPFHSLDCFLKQNIPKYVKHYHADTCYSYIVSKSAGLSISAIKNFIVLIDDSDKKRLSEMSFMQRINDVRSPFEWRSSVFWYSLVCDGPINFFKCVTFHLLKSTCWGLHYKFIRGNREI